MTKITTVAPAPKNVQDFIRSATQGQRMGFLSKGEPQCISFQTFSPDKGLFTVLYPGLRGVIVGKGVETPEEAVAVAAQRLTEFSADPSLVEVDEIALGIDGEGHAFSQRFAEIGCRLEAIYHIGTMGMTDDMPETLADLVSDVEHELASKLLEDMPAIKVAIDRTAAEAKESKEVPSPLRDYFIETCHDEGYHGFVVTVSIPLHKPHADGRGASIHGGIRHLQSRYGANFRTACERALEWAAGEYERMMAERPEAA
jgi:hypothetical protein